MRYGPIHGIVLFGALALILGFVNFQIADRQAILDDGRTVLVPLAPVDPRSLMQGDYMRLAYDVPAMEEPAGGGDPPREGAVVVTLDQAGIATIDRLDDGGALASGELLLRYKLRFPGGGLWWPGQRARLSFGDSFFFPEGQAHDYGGARYAVLKVDEDGESVIAGLADDEARPIAPGE
ncbi:MAG: GDYXXLXY domain-containing protein [Alphaproteobacteria bacterium]